MKTKLGLVCLLAFAVTAFASTSAQPLKLRRGALTNRIHIPLVGAGNACTTQFVSWQGQPDQTLGFNAYCNAEHAPGVAADTWLLNVTFKWTAWPTANGPFDTRSDTVAVGLAIDGAVDTLRTAAKHWAEQYFPRVSQGGYFILSFGESLSDTVWIDSVVFNGSNDK
jgi:hypothetical protein